MYDNLFAHTRSTSSIFATLVCVLTATGITTAARTSCAQVQDPNSVIRKISNRSEKLELTTNSSRILTMDKKIPRVQVNNPELVAVTPLSDKDVQISAKKAGVTQINLWDEDGEIHSIDIMIYGDARELANALQTQFPHSSIKVYRYSESLVLTGFVDRPDHVGPIMRLAEDYAPKVINNINVGGVQQILLKVRIMEVSRTKLRQLGVDWAWFGGNGFAINRAGSLISEFSSGARTIETLGDTFSFGIISDSSSFFGVLDALQERRVAKTLADPNIVAVSGRPAQFQVGGEFPILIPQSLGTTSVEFKPYGTQVDFLPIVLGNGNIRLEVRPRISDIDPSLQVRINDTEIPALTTRQVDTAVEMKAGQTFALAGLVQERTDSSNRGLPYLADLPVLGVPFRSTRNKINEIELLIIITPEFVDPLDSCEVPCDGPGYHTTNPTNRQLYCGGHVEVPIPMNPIEGLQACGQDPCGPCAGCNGACGNGGSCSTCDGAAGMPMITDGVMMPGGVGYDDAPEPSMATDHIEMHLPDSSDGAQDLPLPPQSEPKGQSSPSLDNGARRLTIPVIQAQPTPVANPFQVASRPHNPPRQPVFVRNPSKPQIQQPAELAPSALPGENGLIGPIGYDNQ